MVSTRRILPLILFTLLFALTVREIMDPDFWWHLRTGQYIVQNHVIPHVDIFSSTNAGRPWIAHEWLSEVLMYKVYHAAKWPGLILFFSVIITAAFVITYIRCAGKPFSAAAAVALAAFASFPNWGVRPQMMTLLLASVFLWLLERYAAHPTMRVWWLVPLTALWVNLHASFALGLALILFFIVTTPIDAIAEDRWTPQTRRAVMVLAGVFAASLAVVPLNPNGLRMYIYPFQTLGSTALGSYIPEWQSPNFHTAAFVPFALLMLFTFSVLALSAKRPRISSLLLLVLTAYMALQSGRHIPIFAIVAAPILAEHLTQMKAWQRPAASSNRPLSIVVATTVLLASLAFGVWRSWRVIANQPAWERIEFPAATADFVNAHRPAAPIYNPYIWGGYLIWRLYPEYRVYIDGRNDTYGDEFVAEYFKAARGEISALDAINRHGVNTVIAEVHSPLAYQLAHDQQWAMEFQDQLAVVFTRK